MKTKIVMGIFAVLMMLFTACRAFIPPVLFDDPNASDQCQMGMRGTVPDIPITDPDYDIRSSPVTLYDRPGGDVLGTLPLLTPYLFNPVEKTHILYGFTWYKVWVYGSIIEPEEGVVFPPEGRYVWLSPEDEGISEYDVDGCEQLPFPDGIEGLGCDIDFHQTRPIAARVGPGSDRAIRRYLTSNDTGGQLHVDGRYRFADDRLYSWYRISYSGEHLWVYEGDLSDRSAVRRHCENLIPSVNPPPVIPPPQRDADSRTQHFPVYHCRHLESNVFEWYSAQVTYDGNGNPLSEEITGGPFIGEWREGCPAGDQPLPVQEPSIGEPEQPSDPLPTEEPAPTEPPPTEEVTPPPCDDGC